MLIELEEIFAGDGGKYWDGDARKVAINPEFVARVTPGLPWRLYDPKDKGRMASGVKRTVLVTEVLLSCGDKCFVLDENREVPGAIAAAMDEIAGEITSEAGTEEVKTA